jgi:hypothetical protein
VLTIDTHAVIDDRIIGWVYTVETTSQVDIQWHAGSGMYGISGSTIDSSGDLQGSGDITPTTLQHVDDTCGPSQISNIKTDVPASASIDDLVFDRYYGPTLTGEAIPPQPSKLTVHVHFGKLLYDVKACQFPTDHNAELFEWGQVLLGTALSGLPALFAGGADAIVNDGWTFGLQPFNAKRSWAATVNPFGGKAPTEAKVTLTLKHTPEA